MNPNPSLCPERVRASLIAYRDLGVPPGGFVRAVLENDLRGALRSADTVNREALPHIMAWMEWEMPANIWLSRGAVYAHLANKREERIALDRDNPTPDSNFKGAH